MVDLIDAVFVTITVDFVKRVGKLESVALDVFKILLDDGKLVKLENAEFVVVTNSSTAFEVVEGGLVTFVVVNLRWFSEGTGSWFPISAINVTIDCVDEFTSMLVFDSVFRIQWFNAG